MLAASGDWGPPWREIFSEGHSWKRASTKIWVNVLKTKILVAMLDFNITNISSKELKQPKWKFQAKSCSSIHLLILCPRSSTGNTGCNCQLLSFFVTLQSLVGSPFFASECEAINLNIKPFGRSEKGEMANWNWVYLTKAGYVALSENKFHKTMTLEGRRKK